MSQSRTPLRSARKRKQAKRPSFERCTQAECCRVIGITTRQFQRLIPEVFPDVKRKAGYSLPDIVARYVRYREQGKSADSAAAFKRRELEAEARLKEARVGVVEGTLLEREDVRQTGLAIFGELAARMDAAPGRLVDPIIALTGGDRARLLEVLEREFRGVRGSFADAIDRLIAERRASSKAA